MTKSEDEAAIVFKPGDIVEIDLPDGFCYVQVTHHHVSYPEVVRAIGGRHSGRPDIGLLATGETRFHALFPLSAACRSGRIGARRIGDAAIPEPDRAFPRFKMPVKGKRGELLYWWLWDGDGLTYESDPATDTSDLPLRKILTFEELVERFD